MNRTYLMPIVDIIDVRCETGFAESNPYNDVNYGTGDVLLNYGGYDNEFE